MALPLPPVQAMGEMEALTLNQVILNLIQSLLHLHRMTVMKKVPNTLRKPTIQLEATRVPAKPARKTVDQATGAEDLLENLTGQQQFQGGRRLKERRIGWWCKHT